MHRGRVRTWQTAYVGRNKRARIRCVVPGCPRLIQRRQYCLRHYRERVMPRCSVRGCQRHASNFGWCEPHWKNAGKAIPKRAKRSAADGPRVFRLEPALPTPRSSARG